MTKLFQLIWQQKGGKPEYILDNQTYANIKAKMDDLKRQPQYGYTKGKFTIAGYIPPPTTIKDYVNQMGWGKFYLVKNPDNYKKLIDEGYGKDKGFELELSSGLNGEPKYKYVRKIEYKLKKNNEKN